MSNQADSGNSNQTEYLQLPANLQLAMLQTLSYADIFDFPLTIEELHRYLIGYEVPLETVATLVEQELVPAELLVCEEHYLRLPGREKIVATRHSRHRRAGSLWPTARHYAARIAQLPFVRMVAITGSLANDNVDEDGDIDYLIITAPGRLWLTRLLTIAIVRYAARRNIVICPNYFLTDRVLSLAEQTLYTARELAQMIPLYGQPVYAEFRSANEWSRRFLPNAIGLARELPNVTVNHRRKAWLERIMSGPIFDKLERWEMARKIAKFTQQMASDEAQRLEATFGPDQCKGHFDTHGYRIMQAFKNRPLPTPIDKTL